MELLKFSKFKLRLNALITEVRHLRERERSATDQVQLLIQKQKQTEDECATKLHELQAELASSNELRQKLERQVSYLQSDNDLLENKQKHLERTIRSLLESREKFIKVYRESTCEMRRSIETKDRMLAFLTEKINSQLLLFDSIEKEAFSVKQVVDDVQLLVSEKEQVVAGLRSKMDKISAYEKTFVEKICELDNKLRNDGDELQRKDKIILELEAQLEAAKIRSAHQPQLEELQKTLSAKEVIIQNLISEKKALHFEVGSLGIILLKIQETVLSMNEEDKRTFSSILEGQEGIAMVEKKEYNRIEDMVQNTRENSPKVSWRSAAENTALSQCPQYGSASNPLCKNDNYDSCMSEVQMQFGCSPLQPTCSKLQSAANVLSISVDEAKENHKTLLSPLDSEGSTTQAETSNDPG
ncbi:uncharacterized protein LOC131144108 [Malania oleifera]|uniref:uncharacterized protein LOC131144108 n=1 Tax=Malania oleifera TaxID=397392 RepID=UPI0025AE61E3|nr:uncharacterized protein LOC131144108 [Malania oleifera]